MKGSWAVSERTKWPEYRDDLHFPEDEDDDSIDARAPAVDFSKLSGDGGKEDRRGKKKKKELKFLTTYCTNMTERARMGKLDNVVGRD